MADKVRLATDIAGECGKDSDGRRAHGSLLMLPEARDVHVSESAAAAGRDELVTAASTLRLVAESAELL